MVLRQFLNDPHEPRYGFDLMQATRLPSGTLYPILARLQRAGWITGHQEDAATATAEGRPARRFYLISGEAAALARVELAHLDEELRVGTRAAVLRPGLEGG